MFGGGSQHLCTCMSNKIGDHIRPHGQFIREFLHACRQEVDVVFDSEVADYHDNMGVYSMDWDIE